MNTEQIINHLTEQASRSEPWKVRKLITELRRRIDNNLPIPAGDTTVTPEVAETIIMFLDQFARDRK